MLSLKLMIFYGFNLVCYNVLFRFIVSATIFTDKISCVTYRSHLKLLQKGIRHLDYSFLLIEISLINICSIQHEVGAVYVVDV